MLSRFGADYWKLHANLVDLESEEQHQNPLLHSFWAKPYSKKEEGRSMAGSWFYVAEDGEEFGPITQSRRLVT